MKKRFLALAGGLALLLGACTPYEEVLYFQDVEPGVTQIPVPAIREILIKPKDKISISVTCPDTELTEMFNLRQTSGTMTGGKGGRGYTVRNDGTIQFPVLGRLHVAGMSREELADYIMYVLQSKDLVKEPVVIVEFENLYVNVMGAVGSSRIEIDRDNYTIFDLICDAGDVELSGDRRHVLVVREEEGMKKAYTVDLTKAESVYSSPVYYLRQGDIVYSDYHAMTVRGARRVSGNMFHTYGFWTGLLGTIVGLAGTIASFLTLINVTGD